jgi:hypothetical protein
MEPQEVGWVNLPSLAISLSQLRFIVRKTRELDAKAAVAEADGTPQTTDGTRIVVLENHMDDPIRQELLSFISGLSVEAQIDVVALARLGRGDGTAKDWPSIRLETARRHGPRTVSHLVGMLIATNYLQEGTYITGWDELFD